MTLEAPAAAPALDGARLLARIAELARIGADSTGGVTRLAYSDDDTRGRDLTAGWLREAGLAPRVDPAGNLLADLPGSVPGLPFLSTGSHLDTVVSAGPLDGAYGVVAAVEVAAALAAAGTPLRHPLRVVAFSNEEGARGTPGMIGSSAIAGLPVDVTAPDDEGVPLGRRLRDAGGDPDRLVDAAWRPGEAAAFLELHVEQGPVLEAAGLPIGVVDAVTGRVNVEVVVRGAARHAGTTPMAARRDALVTASRLVLAIEDLAARGEVRVATVGRLTATPGVRNVVPGEARLSLEVRDTDTGRMRRALQLLAETAGREAERAGCAVEVRPGPQAEPVATDRLLRGCIAEAAAALGLGALTLPSGAGHDAQILATVTRVGLCFVPSRGGISHAPEEDTDPHDLVAGTRTLLAALQRADARLDA